MPNYCGYDMKVVGKKENVKEFVKIMKANYDYPSMKFGFDRHMGGRVYGAHAEKPVKNEDGSYSVIIIGYCAWSVARCMFNGGYYRSLKNRYGDECRSTTVPIESERLGLDIEIYSGESESCLMEHYLVRKGKIICNEYEDWYEYCLNGYKSKEEAEEDLDIEITDEEWKIGGYISRGGFENWRWAI